MTDADLNALFRAWLADRAQTHKATNLLAAVMRAHGDALRAPSGRVEAWEDSRGRGSFAGLARAADGTLEPAGGVTHAYAPDAMPAGLKKACGNGARIIEGLKDAVAYAQGDESRGRAHRPEAAFGKPFTVYGSAGPYRPTNPEDAGDGA